MSSQIACINMIKQQLRTGDVLNDRILDLFKIIPRENFVPKEFKHFAYSDMRIDLPHQQKMMAPLEEATLLQSLDLKGTETVLEVGTGTGFLTALLSRLAKHVLSIDYFSDFTAQARLKLAEHQCKNVELVTGDAARGWVDKAPYDVVVFTGAVPEITDTHRLQVLPGGKLFIIVGDKPIMPAVLLTLTQDNVWEEKLIFETSIPPLINKLKPKEFVF
ncbi:protein-L-isoaspartate O-methyltransferase family protein [Legionella londiniensis]|uniref:Protein-L-isoaspartate O-methyltransferase n=1 Tax=Legionella londiniensis TaxID=45068 RepID=A0A0W0VNZ3_9GAMM|nr:protein-L-isoaspartate O-methyltransferase [Legionella londiniensis]KTD21888.1 protein-L-isoaspartate-O-methyltransferase [Legionella londiniensis]STX92629.1 protein-L-isoaspartate-O-methyltransferase [Legionella londiniensis]